VAYLRPGWFVRRVANPLASRLGTATTLAVRGRRSGEWRTVPVNVPEVDGERYLLSPRGACEWVRNLRASGTGELRRRGKVEPFRATDITDRDLQTRVIDEYLRHWGRQVKGYFEQLPDPADHPIFRITPM
jgi:deazaflavin-dependent oxidoreductase (nitroreductase family)